MWIVAFDVRVCVCMCVYRETGNGAKKGEKGIKEEVGHDRTLVA